MKNHYDVNGDSVKVYSNGKNKHLYFFIDKADLDTIAGYSWRVYIGKVNNNYKRVETSITTNNKTTHVMLARFLMGYPKGKFTDHIDCDSLNNRRDNIRLASQSENSRNVPKTFKKTHSKFKGVSWHKRKNKWIATCAVNSKNKFLGYFSNEIDAAKAYDKTAKELHGEFAKTNFL